MCRCLVYYFGALIVLAILAFIFANPLARMLPFSFEKRFVAPYEEMAKRWFGDQLGDADIGAYLSELTSELSDSMGLDPEIVVSVHYLDTLEPNAFATLGAHVFVLRGLIESVESENALAMVIAHELSHIQNRDPLSSMGRGVALQMVLSYFTGNSHQGQEIASFGGELGLLSYSRDQEMRSDQQALDALHAHYGHVSGFDQFFRKMIGELEGSRTAEAPELLSTHPELSSRIDALRNRITEMNYVIGSPKPLPQWLQDKLLEPPANIEELVGSRESALD